MKVHVEWRDLFTRVLMVVAGLLAAILLVIKGEAAALPGLALGGALGACFVHALRAQI